MNFQIPKSLNYHIDDGWHKATLAHINYDPECKGASCKCDKIARLTFYVDSDPRELTQDVAARTFCMDQHSEDLLAFLQD